MDSKSTVGYRLHFSILSSTNRNSTSILGASHVMSSVRPASHVGVGNVDKAHDNMAKAREPLQVRS